MSSTVSIVVPCFNEEKRIRTLLEAVYVQSYPRSLLDLTIADGGSKDRTRDEISNFQAGHPDLRLQVVDNPAGTIPAALNRAIQASKGEVILRLDAHSAPYPDYVENSVRALELEKGDNVGGIWEIRPGTETWVARSIAQAAAHPLGVGDALYRHAVTAAVVDTVPFGCFRRKLVEQIGAYDETLLANEDYEFNARIRKAGGKIWLDPAIRSIYFARSRFSDLARQYYRYGFWKLKMLRRYPGTLRWRQALPPLFTASLALGLILSMFNSIFGWLLVAELILYFGLLSLAGYRLVLKRREYFLVYGLPTAIAIMHVSWGAGFLISIFSKNWKS